MATEVTLKELLERIATTSYLPEWIKKGADDALEDHFTPPPPPPNLTEAGGWCPFVRMVTPNIREPHNRRAIDTRASTIVEVDYRGSTCIKGKCQMWTGHDCGLKYHQLPLPADPVQT